MVNTKGQDAEAPEVFDAQAFNAEVFEAEGADGPPTAAEGGAATEGPTREALEAEAAMWKDRFVRLSADFDNSRKRSAREVEVQVRQQRERMISDWLRVVDGAERGLAQATERSGPWYEGALSLHKLMLDVLTRYGVEPIKAEGELFDPRFHEAIGMIPDPEKASGTVAFVQAMGFKSADDGRIIRPAQVIVVQ